MTAGGSPVPGARQPQGTEEPCEDFPDEVPEKISMRAFLQMFRERAASAGGDAPSTPSPRLARSQKFSSTPMSPTQEEALLAVTAGKRSPFWVDNAQASPSSGLPPLGRSLPEGTFQAATAQGACQGVRAAEAAAAPRPQLRGTSRGAPAKLGPGATLSLQVGGKRAPLEPGGGMSPLRFQMQTKPKPRSVFGGDLSGGLAGSPKLGWQEGQQGLLGQAAECH